MTTTFSQKGRHYSWIGPCSMSRDSRRGFFTFYSPVRAYRRSHQGRPSPLWTMSETAPFQVPICAYLFLLGLWNLITGVAIPASVDRAYPIWLILAWSAASALGCGLSLVGRYIEAFRMESSGLAFLLSACGLYVGAVVWMSGLKGFWAAGGFLAIATGCIIRMLVIRKHHKAQRVAGQILANGDLTP